MSVLVKCRICGKKFADSKWVVERVIDHIESRHPQEALSFMTETEEVLRQLHDAGAFLVGEHNHE